MTRAITTALALAAVALLPSQASAATFRLTVKGTQTTTWDYAKQLAPTCDYPEQENGTQKLTLSSTKQTKPLKITTRGGRLRSVSTPELLVYAKGELRRDYRRLYTQQAACAGGGPYGGGDGPAKDAVGTARCTTDGTVSLAFTGVGRTFGIVGTPLWDDAPEGSSERSLPARCSKTGQSDADIGITQGEGEWAGGLIPAEKRIDAKKLGRLKKGRSMSVAFERSVTYPNAKVPRPGSTRTKGKTVLDLTVKLKRIR